MRRPADLHAFARRRLLAIDLGARYTGLAARTCLQSAPFPCGQIERCPRRLQGSARHATRDSVDMWEWTLQRARANDVAMHALRPDSPTFAPPRGHKTRHGSLAAALATMLDELHADAAIVGMPYHADGSRSRECGLVEQQVAAWQAAWPNPVPVLLWDESFSTRLVVGPSRPVPGSRRDRASHSLAACLILEEVVRALGPLELGAQG